MSAVAGRNWGWFVYLAWLNVACAGGTSAARSALAAATATPTTDVETYKYCGGTVTEWEEHKCIWELTPEQQRRRSYTQRLVYRGGRLVRFETVTGTGAIYKGDTTLTSTYQYEGSRISSWLNTNRNGVVKGSGELSDGGQLVLWQDAQGRPKPKKDSKAAGLRRTLDARGRVLSYAYVDSSGRATSFEKVFKASVKRNAQGAILEERYFGANDEPILDSHGAHRVVHSVDAHGQDLELRYFDEQGRPTLSDGAHLVRRQYDDVGNPLAEEFFDVAGRPAVSSEEGAASLHHIRDVRGNETLLELFDTTGRPVIGTDHFASRRRRFDEHDLPIEWAFFGADGAPLRLKDLGDAIMRQTRDARGNVTRERFYDENATPIAGTDGYHAVDIGYDARDNPISYRYTDVNGAPVSVKQGYQWRKLTYDGDRLIRNEYFDKNERPVNAFDRYAVTEIMYAPDGSEAERRSLDVDGTPLVTCTGSIPPELRTEISTQAAATHSCYENMLRKSPQAAGKLKLELRINAQGGVDKAAVIDDELAEPELTSCALAILRTSFKTRPTGGCAVVHVPLTFQPKPPVPQP